MYVCTITVMRPLICIYIEYIQLYLYICCVCIYNTYAWTKSFIKFAFVVDAKLNNCALKLWQNTDTNTQTHTHVDTQPEWVCMCALVSGSVDELIYVLVCQLTCNLCINFEICFASRSHYAYATWCPTNTHVAKFCAHGRALSNCRRSRKQGVRAGQGWEVRLLLDMALQIVSTSFHVHALPPKNFALASS